MPDIHGGRKELRTPLRLEKRSVPFSFRAQAIFVAVKNIGFRKFQGRARHFEQREKSKDIVVIDTRHQVAGRQMQSAVRVLRDPEILG